MMMLPSWRPACALTLFSTIFSGSLVHASTTDNACGRALGATGLLTASEVYNCLVSTPFRPDIATELLDYWKTTLRFQSTLAYLRDPPRSYQQPPVDLIRGFDLIRAQIDAGVFENQYAFEAAVQTLLQATHDGNVYLAGSVMGVFEFGIPENLVAVTSDGVSVPQVYFADDLINAPNAASPLVRINGEVAEDFLTVFASENSLGFVEPHGDWNGLMYSGAKQNLGLFGSITDTIFYPGDFFTAELANGTTSRMPWSAHNIQGDGLNFLQTGEDFYNYFVLGQLPANYNPVAQDTAIATATGDSATATDVSNSGDGDAQPVAGWPTPYPSAADVVQPNLGNGGYLTGYLLKDSSTGVLSIPSFGLSSEAASSFSSTVGEFIQRSKGAGMQKIVIDLQQNSGGDRLLVVDTFAQFFPSIKPFSGMRSRSFALANEIGNTFTNTLLHNATALNETFLADLSDDPFTVVANELNANTNSRFTSWPDYYGPYPNHGDAFSAPFTANLTDISTAAATNHIVLFPQNQRYTKPPYDAKDIVLLTDGACSSECDYFMELMHHEAGVPTIVVGGLPQYGPMQARGGPRGGMVYASDNLDQDFQVASSLNSSLAAILPRRTSPALDKSRMLFNFADQIRPKEPTPLQFVYEAADCRIFWDKKTFNNYTLLWAHAAEAIFHDRNLCVPRSAEHNNTLLTDIWGPSPEQLASWASTNPAYADRNNGSLSAIAGLAQGQYDAGLHLVERAGFRDLRTSELSDRMCQNNAHCGNDPNNWVCIAIRVTCGKIPHTASQCKRPCVNRIQNTCFSGMRAVTKSRCSKPGPGCAAQCYCEGPRSMNDDKVCQSLGKTGPPVPVVTAVHGDALGFEGEVKGEL